MHANTIPLQLVPIIISQAKLQAMSLWRNTSQPFHLPSAIQAIPRSWYGDELLLRFPRVSLPVIIVVVVVGTSEEILEEETRAVLSRIHAGGTVVADISFWFAVEPHKHDFAICNFVATPQQHHPRQQERHKLLLAAACASSCLLLQVAGAGPLFPSLFSIPNAAATSPAPGCSFMRTMMVLSEAVEEEFVLLTGQIMFGVNSFSHSHT